MIAENEDGAFGFVPRPERLQEGREQRLHFRMERDHRHGRWGMLPACRRDAHEMQAPRLQ
jgi:hypothetical protein